MLRSIAHIVKGSGGQVPEYMLKLKKATRQEKRKLAKSAVKRPAISTESLYDKEKRQKLEAMLKGSKNRKRKADQRAADRKVKQEAKKAKMESDSDNKPKKYNGQSNIVSGLTSQILIFCIVHFSKGHRH